MTDSEKTEIDEEIEIVEVRKGKPMASRRSSRVASHGTFHRENIVDRETVRKTEKRKKNEKQKKKVEEKANVSDHKEPRSKNKHDKDAREEELLSEMLQKAKMTKKAAKECEELRQQAKRKGDSRGVDPSAEKKQKFEKRAEEKEKEKVTKETYFDSSDSDDEGLIMVKALPIDLIWRKRVIRSKIVRERWMNDNGLSNVMELIKRQKWENLFKRRELVHIDVVKEFYAKMSMVHLKKRDVVKSKVRGVDMEFDHEKLATILGVPGKNGICEYIKDVWEESKYTKPLEITRRFTNDGNLMAARRVKSGELKPFQRFVHFLITNYPTEIGSLWFSSILSSLVDKTGEEPKIYDYFQDTFLTMCKLTSENGIWWIGSGENRRRDDDVDAPEEEAKEEDEGNKDDFDWEVVVEEVATEGNPAQERNFMMPRIRIKAEFERKRANRFLADLEKAKAENARLLSLLNQAQSKPHP
ncbi:hypothetical protein Dimus_037472 [Dionaea muscipula]